ncbi:MAG: pyruvate formate lyase family protein [Lachnospiraceae bacterium]|nr:pyruvate formate lyase family protein [Lachnospiraceae bacterium]
MTAEERIQLLKDAIRIEPEFCIERARLYMEAHKETTELPPALRRAKIMEKIMTERSALIYDEELLVGNPTSKRVAAPILAEIAWKWYIEKEPNSPPGDLIDVEGGLTDDEKIQFREILKYWDGKCLRDQWLAVVPQEYRELENLAWMQSSGNPSAGYYLAHCIPDYEKVLKKGIRGILEEIDERLEELDPIQLNNMEAIIFLKAMKISLNSVIVWAQHLSEEAARQAKECADPQRKAELEKIAYICNKVPAEPAENFYEALQSVWIIYIAIMQESWGPGVGFGRMDQYLYPYYRKDIDSSEITQDQVKELIAMLYLKLNELVNPFPVGKSTAGTLSGITIGGESRDGTQATEELAMLFLEAEDMVSMIEDLVVRIHHSCSDAFLYRACQLATSVRGKVKFLCDETVYKQQMNMGRTYAMAREYAATGCFIHTIPGKTHDPGSDAQNLPMMLELALNNGYTRLFHKKIGAETGDPRNFKSYEELWEAYKTQVATVVPQSLIGVSYFQQLWATYFPSPMMSALFDGCIERGRDVVNGGTAPYSSVGLWVTGTVNVGDSLAAVKKVVFDDKKITMAQLIDALDNNFEGAEDILYLLKKAPKFGNDIDYVDNIVNDVICNLADELEKIKGHAGRKFMMAAATIGYNQAFGFFLGASPDGRRAHEALGEGGISPHQGRNTSGATATTRSVAKLNLVRSAGGNVLNMKFDPSSVDTPVKMMNFVNFLRTFASTGGDVIQFNMVSNEMLLDAQKHPEKYRDLLVRVATYSAYFVDLDPMAQQEIIDRTSFGGF